MHGRERHGATDQLIRKSMPTNTMSRISTKASLPLLSATVHLTQRFIPWHLCCCRRRRPRCLLSPSMATLAIGSLVHKNATHACLSLSLLLVPQSAIMEPIYLIRLAHAPTCLVPIAGCSTTPPSTAASAVGASDAARGRCMAYRASKQMSTKVAQQTAVRVGGSLSKQREGTDRSWTADNRFDVPVGRKIVTTRARGR